MAQHDYNIANATFPSTRSDLNDALLAVASNNSGTAAPSTTHANQWFYETDTNLLQIRNEDNDAYITIAELDQTNDTVEFLKADSIRTALIEFTDGDDAITIADGGGCTFGVGVTITTGDNSDTLTLTSTDGDGNAGPNLRMYRNSSSPDDGNDLGVIDFEGRNDNSQDVVYAQIKSLIIDQADGAEFGKLELYHMFNGSLAPSLQLTSTEVVINESSNNLDFRVESDGNTHMLFVDAGNNRVGINSSDPSRDLDIGGGGIINLEGSSNALLFEDSGTLRASITSQSFGAHNGDGLGIITNTLEPIKFFPNGSEKMRLESGSLFINKTSSDNSSGVILDENSGCFSVVSGAACGTFNRLSNDGIIIQLNQASSQEGNISVSGSTVSYNGFTGSHWSRLADNSKPTILRGTIMESLDTMMDWYQVRKDIEEVKYTADDQEVIDGNEKIGNIKNKSHTAVQSIALPDGKSVGDSMDFTSNGVNYTGTIVKEDDIKHIYCKISDTADSKKVYGLFHCWDDADDGQDGDVNDLQIAQAGTYIIRINKDVIVEAGDLLVSNGDGTAKVQDDDIIRSKTVARVNSNVKIETYNDGSYTVPCTLHC
tara:strand:+ start:1284 stop:3080 length:1797 start_codon:yes stop_codon:yes gene_type:complete